MTQDTTDLVSIYHDCTAFSSQFKSVLLATADATGTPHSSYAAYYEDSGNYYIYISDLAKHTVNLKANSRCSILFIENEEQAKQLFARRRLSYQCTAELILRDSAQYTQTVDQFEAKFGNFIGMLRQLKDFNLFKLCPNEGTYVLGFAQAYTFSESDLARFNKAQGREESTQ